MKTRILQINNCHYRRGGADAVYLNTIKLLRDNGEEVIEFSQKSSNNEQSDYEPYFVREFDPLKFNTLKKMFFSPRQLFSFETANKLKKLIHQEKPDIAHIHLYKGVLTASILKILKKEKIPTCITLHDYSLLCPRNILFDSHNKICERCVKGNSFNCVIHKCNRNKLLYSIINYIEYNINNKLFKPENVFNKIIAVSKFNYVKHQQKKNLKGKFVHLYNFSPGCEDLNSNPTKGDYFLYFGRLSNEKGLSTLIESLNRQDENINLKIVGTGDIKQDLEALVNKEGLNNIEFLGYKSGEELKFLIANCSYVIVPSEWYENNPMTIVEAYALGKPVIGSKIGGIPELIEDEVTGFTFEMGNVDDLSEKIREAEKISQQEYNKMSGNARKFALNNFSEKVHYRNLMNIYKSMLAE